MRIKSTSIMTIIGLFLLGLLLFSPGGTSVVFAGFTPTPEPPTSTPVLPPTNTPVPVATNTSVPAATNTPIPAATNTSVPAATNTPVSQAATNTPSSNSGGGSSSNPTSTPETVVNREARANVAENAPNIPALGEGISLQLLLILNGVFLLLLIGLVFAWRAVARAMRKNDR